MGDRLMHLVCREGFGGGTAGRAGAGDRRRRCVGFGVAPATAVKWMRQAGGDWSSYAAELVRARNHQT